MGKEILKRLLLYSLLLLGVIDFPKFSHNKLLFNPMPQDNLPLLKTWFP